ncbi:hypothetical protein [Mycobacterium sp. E3198]|uniref:hypothetical protein n=1 Tax=Mycobacterium sp. E3198 TaxID=1834143 RepID=UPI0007FBA631|nr:hypothetical protein [Mycobacterium sp. E3198]OBG38444.1 hypothetical protein A5673_14850 [Mycobacterium sp. E3198]
MTTSPEQREPVNIDDDVAFITEQMERLKELGDRDGTGNILDDEDVYDLSVRWGTALAGRLPRIAHYSATGALTDCDEHRFQSLCDGLRELSPLIERFKLTHPDLAGCPDTRANGRHRQKKPAAKRRRLLAR